jgi:hypothetical protein
VKAPRSKPCLGNRFSMRLHTSGYRTHTQKVAVASARIDGFR